MRIMTKNFVKGQKRGESRFKNSLEDDISGDGDYQQRAQETRDTQKMSHILKSLNSPVKRK